MNFDLEYTREDIIRMKRYTYALKYNITFNYQSKQKDAFQALGFSYPTIRNETAGDAAREYSRRNIPTIIKGISTFDKIDIDIWTPCYIYNLNKEISVYERKHGVIYLELSQEFDDFINNRNNVINQERLYVKGTQALGFSQIIDTITSVIEIGSTFTKKEVPYLDEALLGLKGISYAIKQRNGTITDKDKIGAGIDLMSYIATKSTQDENIKKALTVTSSVIGLCLEFLIGNR